MLESVGLPRYLATASLGDVEDTVRLVDGLEANASPDPVNAVALVQCGRASPAAADIARVLTAAGRRPIDLVVTLREEAQADDIVQKLTSASSVWVFAEDLFEAFNSVFATELAFALRSAAKDGLPVVGVGSGALALGGLLLAHRVCHDSRFELVPGLGWAPRVLVDGGTGRGIIDAEIARDSVRSLPGLLGIDLSVRGGVRVQGWRVESVGEEPILLFGTDEAGKLLTLPLEPGQVTTIAPPPFAPFARGLVPPTTLAAAVEHPERVTPGRPAAKQLELPEPERGHAKPIGGGVVCPMCHKVHTPDPKVVLAA